MPTKTLTSQTDRKEIQATFKFGGGKNEITAIDDEVAGYGYIINAGGGDDTIFGSDFTGLGFSDPVFDPLTDDARTEFGDLLIGGMGSDSIVGGGGDDWIYGGNEDGSDGGKGKDPEVSNHLVGDTEFGSVDADDTVIFGSDHIFGGNGVDNTIYGDSNTLVLGADASFTGGIDIIQGGEDSTNLLYGDVAFGFNVSDPEAPLNITIGATFTGGGDIISGGAGTGILTAKNEIYGDAAGTVTMDANGTIGSDDVTLKGGDDTITGGMGADNTIYADFDNVSLRARLKSSIDIAIPCETAGHQPDA